MLVFASKMRATAAFIALQLYFSELRHRDSESVADSPQPRCLCLTRCLCDLLEEISSERIVSAADGTVRLAHQLRDNMEVANRFEKRCQFAEIPVDIDLLKVRLREQSGVRSVGVVRAIPQNGPITHYPFSRNAWPALRILVER